MKTTYFVSGYMRTGTSMMMAALEAGGLEAVYNPEREKLNGRCSDEHYSLNKGGLYELSRQEYQKPGFPRGYEGKLIKYLFGGIPRIVPGRYKIVFMRRDYEEIRQSQNAGLNGGMKMSEEDFQRGMDDTVGILNERRDCQVIEIWMRDVIEAPLKIFKMMKEKGWPIDPVKAASIVNPELYRFRRERLTAGL